MNQEKGTINVGDALRDALTMLILKEKRNGLWYGAVESDKTVKPYDFTIGHKTAEKLFGFDFAGTIKVGYQCAHIRQTKNIDELDLPLDVDYYIHVRHDTNDEPIALIIPRVNLQRYFETYRRNEPVLRNGCWNRQLDVGKNCPKYGSKKWRDLESFTIGYANVKKIMDRTIALMTKVNENGRDNGDSSNRFNNDRKVGEPYSER